ncbi:hypothetical protein DICPUDRAFT_31641 [Dictyostelium purpureum]|uniref:Nuclear receptor 2C2-associated protein n=1 Tax=Dictyostelium purpureum TaxID=5786 RepID=F0ZHI3_DICPU|nr:uncharacterized protein DICPUDRAFT_31641 [Dictyostelium purpureum]EGC36591.1 hypothetical protein DICPUDRAFT_31641 [Dictyostelium purpureum]|eukprot:XP_003286895.1 hypothetical protein DICPUDRAFT_31641 [Dictyostelium purpureum]
MESLLVGDYKSKVSSVLNKNTKEYGKEFLFDGSDETCWNSHQGSPQSIVIQFAQENVTVKQVNIMFQGGFVGKDCEILIMTNDSKDFVHSCYFYPKDINTTQNFPVESNNTNVKQIKILFPQSTDFFGRITIYKLDILGTAN